MEIKRNWGAMLIALKIDFKSSILSRDKKCYYIMTKGSIHQENITTINIYEAQNGAPNCSKQILTKLKRRKRQQYNNIR